jgi:hypothetical protein
MMTRQRCRVLEPVIVGGLEQYIGASTNTFAHQLWEDEVGTNGRPRTSTESTGERDNVQNSGKGRLGDSEKIPPGGERHVALPHKDPPHGSG